MRPVVFVSAFALTTSAAWARRAVERLQPGAPMPPGAKIAGACSLGIWLAVAACGRSIAYF